MLTQHTEKLIATVLIISILEACSGENKANAPGQIAAVVNGEEISIYQLEDTLHQAGLISDEKGKQAIPQLLTRLIDQSLIMQQAMADKLEREPNVMTAMENAKKQILTEAWLQRKMQSVKKPSAQEIEDFYNTHPELFGKRKVFQLKEFFIESSAASALKIDQIIGNTVDISTLEQNLETNKIPFNVNMATVAAEQLPMERLPLLSTLPNGHFIKVPSENGVLIQGVLSAKESPIDKTKAASFIEAALYNQARKKDTYAAIKQLHDTAKIEYLGEFAKLFQTEGKEKQETQAPQIKQP
jgi:EpsD family peptidyl-prolyl cis-trans isomerase